MKRDEFAAERRSTIIEALSWWEDIDVGRWGHERAEQVLSAHEGEWLQSRWSASEIERALRAADAPEDSMATDEDLIRHEGRAEAVEIVRDMLGLGNHGGAQ